jgi:hypothetical protein
MAVSFSGGRVHRMKRHSRAHAHSAALRPGRDIAPRENAWIIGDQVTRPATLLDVMIVDLTNIGALADKERKHLELSVYVGYALERAQKFEQAVALLVALSRAEDRLDDDEAFRADLDRLMSRRMAELLRRGVEQGLIT